jgi:hypothetical protein
VNDLEAILNDLNRKTLGEDGATLSLIAFPETGQASDRQAVAFVAGDSYLFHGNLSHRGIAPIEGIPDFVGTPNTYLKPIAINLTEGDFFIIASDGILSIRGNDKERALEDVLRERVDGDLQDFALRAIRDSNRYLEERIYDRTLNRFGGSDNISALLVHPEGLADIASRESFILGGYIQQHRS